MKIIYISDYPVKYHAETILEICKKNNIEIDQLYISNYRHTNEENFQDKFPFKFINQCYSEEKPHFFSFCFNFKFLKKMFNYDLIWMHGYNHIYLLVLPIFIFFSYLIFRTKKPKLVFRGELSCLSENSGILKRLIKRQYFKFFDAFFFIGAANYLFIRHELKAKGLYYFLPYMRNENFSSAKVVRNFSEEVNFLSVGRLESRKNHLEFLTFIKQNIEFLKASLKKNINITLVGDGPLNQKINEWINKNSVEGLKIILKGRLEGDILKKEYQNADFFFLVSRREPYGMVCSEARSFGIPMILSREVGAGYDYVDGVSNIWFDIGGQNINVRQFIIDHGTNRIRYHAINNKNLNFSGVKNFFQQIVKN